MEEGHERKLGKDIKNFFRMSKGSTGEAKGRYKRLEKIFAKIIVDFRMQELSEIKAMLASLINKWA